MQNVIETSAGGRAADRDARPIMPPGKRGREGERFHESRRSFLCFMRRFWNQTLTCASLSCRVPATSTRLARVRYLLKWKSFSSFVSCLVLNDVLDGATAALRTLPPPTGGLLGRRCRTGRSRAPVWETNGSKTDQWGDPQIKAQKHFE